jgi:FKBP-type peptidyl-prolyl cis-trans isomerase SlyD
MSELSLADGMIGIIHYTLHKGDGEIVDSSAGRQPMPYLHGAKNIVPGLEKALEGKVKGDKIQAVIAPADGYGEADGREPQRVRRRELPEGQDYQPGKPFSAEMGEGEFVTLWVTDVQGAWVWITVNHPLAGVELHFDVDVVGVRSALKVELEHGHPHGIDGTQGHQH